MKTFKYTKLIGDITCGDNVIIDDFVFIGRGTVELGNNIHISTFTSIVGGGKLIMEDFSGLSTGVRIITGTDDFKGWGFGNPTIDNKYRNVITDEVKIGKFSIIGANSVILPGVIIGEGVSVAAGSVVTRSLQDWGIYFGNMRIGFRDKQGVLKNYEQYKADKAITS